MRWIKCDLPFNYDYSFDDIPETQAIDIIIGDIRKIVYDELGCTDNQEREKLAATIDWRHLVSSEKEFRELSVEEILGKAYSLQYSMEDRLEGQYRANSKEFKKNQYNMFPGFKIYHEYRKKYNKLFDKKYKASADVAKYEKAKKAFIKEQKRKSFLGRGLNKPGTLIEILNAETNEKKQYIIGDITSNGCYPGEFRMFPENSIVLRYARLDNALH